MSENATVETENNQAPAPEAGAQDLDIETGLDDAESLAEKIKKDPAKAEAMIKKLREENKNVRLKNKEYEDKLAAEAAEKEKARQEKMKKDGELEQLANELTTQLEELKPFKDKWLELEKAQGAQLEEKIGKIENEEHRKLIQNSTLPILERLSLADSLITTKPAPNPGERGGGRNAKGPEPQKQNILYNPNR